MKHEEIKTIADIARLAGVSPATVSRVINNSGYVGKETRKKVEQIVKISGFRPNMAAKALATSKTNLVGLIVPNLDNPVYLDILKGVNNACMQQNYSVVLGQGGMEPDEIKASMLHLASLQVDGLILALSDYQYDEIQEYIVPVIRNNIPIVKTGKAIREARIDGVLTDPFETGKLAGQHLARQGHERVVILGECDTHHYFLHERVHGFKSAFLEHGIGMGNINEVPAELTQAGGYLAALDIFKQAQRPTAIFTLNDIMAVGVMAAADESAVTIPGDIAVMGIDGISLGSIIKPRLTTVALPTFEMGQQLFELLHARIEDDYKGDAREINYHGRLVIRDSTLSYTITSS
ncbi:MAG: LacI family transcriptional regulator [bacterium]|nr:LacI family transcriptional regulator [bacterium]